jgi:ribonuclease BN (tRNA processing enzyme)
VQGDGLRVTAFDVDHTPVEPALGYRFDTDRVSIVFSGDTKPCDNLIRYATGTDVLVHEVLCPGFGFADYHTSSYDVGRIASAADARELVVTHMIPGDRPDEAWLSEIAIGYDGPVRVGHDLMPLT